MQNNSQVATNGKFLSIRTSVKIYSNFHSQSYPMLCEDRAVEPITVGQMKEITEDGHTPQAERLGEKAGFGVTVDFYYLRWILSVSYYIHSYRYKLGQNYVQVSSSIVQNTPAKIGI